MVASDSAGLSGGLDRPPRHDAASTIATASTGLERMWSAAILVDGNPSERIPFAPKRGAFPVLRSRPFPSHGKGEAFMRAKTVRAVLVGGPMYDGLYETIPAFERESGLRVEAVARLPHPELNAWVKGAFSAGDPDVDLLSTHTKYAPSQAAWLQPLDEWLDEALTGDLLPGPAELSRLDGRWMQVPRNLDMRLLYFRRDLFEEPDTQEAFARHRRRPLAVPETWDDLVEVAIFLTGPRCHGFLFPGRDSGLFGTFYELLVSAGGALFTDDLVPAFDSPAGIWAADRLAELHHRRRVTPPALPEWHYDEISAAFRQGDAAMVCEWPGGHYLYRDPHSCAVATRFGVALLPAGFTGRRAAYGGCHSFAVARGARNREGALALLRHFTSQESQVAEARRGAVPVRRSALEAVRREAAGDAAETHRWELLARTMAEALIIPPRFAAYPACEDAIWHAVQRALTGTLTPAAAVREAAGEVARVVSRGRA
jgi:multiple sugar transport system substrate-binding protein